MKKRNEALNLLKKARERNESLVTTYKPSEAGDIYEEIDEKDYNNIVKRRLKEESFVVDDDGCGYADDGQEVWDDSPTQSSDQNQDKRLKKKKANLHSDSNKSITDLWHRAATKSSAARESTATNAKDFLDSLHEQDTICPAVPRIRPSERMKAVPQAKEEKKAIEIDSLFEKKKENNIIAEQDEMPTFDEVSTPKAHDSFDEDYFSPDDIAQVDSLLHNQENDSIVNAKAEPLSIVNAKAEPSISTSVAAADSKNQLVFEDIPTLEIHQEPILPTSAETPTLEDSANFYWIDLQEKPNSNTVYLLGKILDSKNTAAPMQNCCVTVTQIPKTIYFLPSPDANPSDLIEEINQLMHKFKITNFTKKIVSRKYVFEQLGVPVEAEYVKVSFPWNANTNFPSQGKFYSHVFGCATSLAESLIVKRKIMGPCWLSISKFTLKPGKGMGVSWNPVEVEVPFKNISPYTANTSAFPEPLFDVVALDFKTLINQKTATHEIVAASILVFKGVDINQLSIGSGGVSSLLPSSSLKIVRHIDGVSFPPRFQEHFRSSSLQVVKGERNLINRIATAINIFNPDILIGHNILNFDLDVLLNRIRECQAEEWPKLGRLKFSILPKAGTSSAEWAVKQLFCGRLICDTYIASRDLVKSKIYSLESLAASELGIKRPVLEEERIVEYFNNADSLTWLLNHCENDSLLAARLAFKIGVLPLTRQLTILAGNVWWRTFAGARAERNEFLLLHEFHRAKYILPDKQQRGKTSTFLNEQSEETASSPAEKKKKGAAFTGGLVLEPQKGLYDKFILLLDYNSLYPSIIQEFNICFTTIQRATEQLEEQLPELPEKNVPQGILPKLLANLVARRRQVKALMKEPGISQSALADLEIRQKALKLTANSMYGCLGFQYSRFHAKQLAMLVTAKGREILQSTVQIAQEQCGLQVVYGDTDSVMINTNTTALEDALRMGQELKKAVNEKYRLLEIEIDAVFSRLLLLKKKKYAALQQFSDGSTKLEMKGLDLVRRDWCDLSVDISTFALNQIMQPEAELDQVVQRIHENLTQMAESIRAGKIPLAKFVINKSLTKPPSEYSDAHIHPHVQVALAMQSRGLIVKVGDVIPYVIVTNNSSNTTHGTAGALGRAARHPDDLSKDSSLQVDYEWYLTQQVHPPITRLCEYIEGTDPVALGACLGLKINSFALGNNASDKEFEATEFKSFFSAEALSELANSSVAHSLLVGCPHCKEENIISPSWLKEGQSVCTQCSQAVGEVALWLSILSYWKGLQTKYYASQVVCEDGKMCQHRSTLFDLSLSGMKCPSCESGSSSLRVAFGDRDLFFAMKAVWWMFSQADNEDLYGNLLVGISIVLDEISFRTVDVEALFSSLVL